MLRDVDALVDAALAVTVGVHVSIPTLDERVWRTTEPATAPPARRLDVVRRLASAGIDVGVAVAPILPGLSDRPAQLRAVVHAARAAGARSIWANVVFLKPGTREHFLAALGRDWPEELERYELLYDGRSYLPDSVALPVKEAVRRAAAEAAAVRRPVLRPAPRHTQLALTG